MTIQGQPDLSQLKDWLGLEAADTYDDKVLQESLDAALEAQCRVVCYPKDAYGDPSFTADLRTALFIRAQRYAARRNSPEGVVGLSGIGGDFVSARIPSFDSDVLYLEGPHRKIVVA